MGKYVFGQEEQELKEGDVDLSALKESLKEDGFALETGKTKSAKYNMKEAKLGKKPMAVKKQVVEKKQMKEFSENTPEYEQAIRFLIKDLVKNHGVSRGASLDRILAMFQSFYNKALEYSDTAGANKAQRVIRKYL